MGKEEGKGERQGWSKGGVARGGGEGEWQWGRGRSRGKGEGGGGGGGEGAEGGKEEGKGRWKGVEWHREAVGDGRASGRSAAKRKGGVERREREGWR